MLYRVTKQFERGPESTLHQFMKREEAAVFIQERLADDARFKVPATYRIYDDLDEVLKEYTLADYLAHPPASSSSSESSSQSAGKSSSFNPTPFSTRPQPSALPRSWVNEVDEEDHKKK